MIGTGKDALITLVERSTRFGLIRRLPINHESPTVIEALTQMVSHLPKDLIRTLTWDQGVEMAQVATFTVVTGCDVYFCDPHSPWQRGSNENFNGLLRQFFPEGTNFSTVTDAQVRRVQDLLNIRPRHTLDWDSPADRLNTLIQSVALTT